MATSEDTGANASASAAEALIERYLEHARVERRLAGRTLDIYAEHLRTLAANMAEAGLPIERVTAALERLGSPQDRLKVVTIAGTNGKGSTASYMTAMAHEAGYRVGLYTSPHTQRRSSRGSGPISHVQLSGGGSHTCIWSAASGPSQVARYWCMPPMSQAQHCFPDIDQICSIYPYLLHEHYDVYLC